MIEGTGLPLVTPFDEDECLSEPDLRELVDWVTDRGIDFVVPCGSNGEAVLMNARERTRVIEVVSEATDPDVPVLAGTGTPSFARTLTATRDATEAGADAALVVTPYYHSHDQHALTAYYEELADESPIPIYLYSVPKYTGTTLDPRAVEQLAAHDSIAGMKDSSGDLELLQRYRTVTEDEDFDLLVGSGSIYAAGLDVGADGGVLALANAVPEGASEIYRAHTTGDDTRARAINRDLVALNRAVTGRYGVPGLKAALRARDVPAGRARRPFRPVSDDVRTEIETLVDDALS
jgi:4-hydroxy-tetrahydrodipicolinate synthase/4-hydroxy-2-oxoglutarate aldolase